MTLLKVAGRIAKSLPSDPHKKHHVSSRVTVSALRGVTVTGRRHPSISCWNNRQRSQFLKSYRFSYNSFAFRHTVLTVAGMTDKKHSVFPVVPVGTASVFLSDCSVLCSLIGTGKTHFSKLLE
ncbi:hypothetical protein BaRGS_00012873 [Batillaria attramentaria]|uniref:Uncharacterized protein n=1 Tax=Batillaria attramentaria TaxID=370345 RepID=A0ABD0L9L7_9CAEN